MKRILVILIPIFLFAGCKDMSYEIIVNGKVKTIIENIYAATGTAEDPLKGSLVTEATMEFNKNGQIVSDTRTTYIGSNKLVVNTTYVYEDGLLKVKQVSGTNYYKIVCEYDEDNNRIKESKFAGGSLDVKGDYYTMEYVKSEMTKKSHYNQINALLYVYNFTYDRDGNISDMKTYNSTNALISTTTYNYDSKGNIITQTEFDNSGTQTKKYSFIYTYGKKDNYTKQVILVNDNVSGITEREVTFY